jgi:ABC-type proline/glycine betaine transport system ATPase subunit
MTVNGVPSDDWKVSKALGPYAKKPNKDEMEAMERALKKKKAFISHDREDIDFKMPF